MTERIPPELYLQIEAFLFQEAALLEASQFEEWLGLLTDDVKYFMPVRETVERPQGVPAKAAASFALFDDDKASLSLRVGRILSGLAHAEVPPSATQRLITNIRAEPCPEVGNFDVRSNFLVHQVRRGKAEYTFIGNREDRLRRVGGDLKLSQRTIRLVQTVLPATISIFL
jgi:3-phenylpropionate/cinnamic acid dioxygenase small subunit